MDTLRLALSAKQLAAIPDTPDPVMLREVRELQQVVSDLQVLAIRLQRDVAELQAEVKRRH